MAKPADTVQIWAKAGVFTNGPYAGLTNMEPIPDGAAEEGFIPGSANPSAAEHVNDWLNRAAKLIHWVYQGSYTGDPDAHIVETDSAGKTQLQRLRVEPTGGSTDTVEILGKVGIGQQYALTVEGLDCYGGACFFNSNVAEGISVGGGPMSYAVWAIGSFAGGGGIRAEGQAGWSGGYFESTDADAIQAWATGNGNGLQAHAGGTGAYGLWGDGNTLGDGVYGTGGATSGYGVVGECLDTFYAGVLGRSAAAGQVSAAGVMGEGRGDAAGGYLYASGNGWGAVLSAYGTRAPLLLNARFDDPSDTTDGQLFLRGGEGGSGYHFKIRSGEWRGVWSSRNGYCHAYIPGDDVSTSATTIGVPATAFGAYNQPKKVGKVVLFWVGEVGRTGTCQITVDIVDVTGGVIVASRTFALYQSGAGVYERTEVLRHHYTLPAAGARTWRVDITKSGGGGADVVRVRNQSLEVRGVFD